jgi:hypothetical protein
MHFSDEIRAQYQKEDARRRPTSILPAHVHDNRYVTDANMPSTAATGNSLMIDANRYATDTFMPSPAATANSVMIDADEICVCGTLKAAVLASARTANEWINNVGNVFYDRWREKEMHVRLRYLTLVGCATSYEESGSEAYAGSVLLDYEQVPGAVARMVVQLPSTYAAGPHGTVTASLNGNTKTFTLDAKCDESLQYVFSYSQSVTRIHAPRHGCAIFLIYDIVSMTKMYEPPLRDNSVAEAKLEKCVQFWEQDAACEKLAVVLHGVQMIDKKGNFVLDMQAMPEHDRAIVRFLKSCPQLEVGYAGRQYLSISLSLSLCVCIVCK